VGRAIFFNRTIQIAKIGDGAARCTHDICLFFAGKFIALLTRGELSRKLV
jgi:hypothetical protein